MEKINFVTDDNEEVEFYIIEETRVNGYNYILVTDSQDEDDEEAEAYILKDVSDSADPGQHMNLWKMMKNLRE